MCNNQFVSSILEYLNTWTWILEYLKIWFDWLHRIYNFCKFFSNIIIREHMFVWRAFWIHGIMNLQKRQARAGIDPRNLHPLMLFWGLDYWATKSGHFRRKDMTLIFIVNGHISSIIAFSDYVTTSNKDAAGKRLEEM